MLRSLLLAAIPIAFAPTAPDTTITHRVFFEVSIDGKKAGNIEFGLYSTEKRCRAQWRISVRSACTGEKGIGRSGKVSRE